MLAEDRDLLVQAAVERCDAFSDMSFLTAGAGAARTRIRGE